ncbi:MAG: Gldg family protein [Myxococcota bacterium]
MNGNTPRNQSQRTKLAGESITYLIVLVSILALVNVLGSFGVAQRIDVTRNELFSLSEGSRRLARSLEDQLEITAYFTEDLPPPDVEQYIRDILSEYEAASNGNIRVKVVTPDEEEEQLEAEEAGLIRLRVQDFENDGFTYKEGYRGFVIQYLGERRAINVDRDTSGLEYQITTTLKELSGEKKTVGVLSVGGGATLSEGMSNLGSWLPGYELQDIDATESIDPSEIAAVLVVDPTESLSEGTLRRLNDYVMAGGSLGLFGGTHKVAVDNIQTASASRVDTGVNQLISPWGVRVKNALILDRQCQPIPTPTNLGGMRVQIQMPYFALPIVGFDDAQQAHPVAFRITSTAMPFPSQLELSESFDEETGVTRTVIASSSEYSWLADSETIRLSPRPLGEWPRPAEVGPFPIAVAVEGRVPNAFPSAMVSSNSGQDSSNSSQDLESSQAERAGRPVRILISGTGMFLTDVFLPDNQAGTQVGRSSLGAFSLNSVDWLAQDNDLIAVRAKTVEEPALEVPAGVQEAERSAREAEDTARAAIDENNLEAAEDAISDRERAIERLKDEGEKWNSKKALYRWANTLGIPLFFALIGVFRWRSRISKRNTVKLD